ncbi:glycosyl hydrolase 43 family protein [Lachnospiraceae bacterium MD1]|jgi:beta-xylosidase|uniref:Glycosyl hydrolase 43 family protein n=1 Tax=Variimorphobacter saccharofermentans TaxID=2755051 RepID=A0A839JYL4_9FIRM|nr:glycoside hydrolase 43 family protein [Variimorphobacter saccharofermentans]MBB2182454.1 glycosyl hydrolase 43 family protein [Variimorphobacter saccharofermentans]
MKNPIIWSDFPDPDVIRVEDTYYMISTTMHFMPGGVIMRSYDLVHWEIVSYVFDKLDSTPEQKLEGKHGIYGKGMWAASLRYHKGMYYVVFVANDTGKTYLYQSEDIMGPWRKQNIEGFYHDCSILFDDDDRVYIVYGNTQIHLTELKSDLTGPKPGGLNRIIITDNNDVDLGYEGSHLYKINGKYYIFMIHWLSTGSKRRTESCYVSDSLEGEFIGKDVVDDDMNYHNSGVAQGGIVDTPDGEWYAMLFQDHGAVGRIPVLIPVHWEDDFPVFGENGKVPIEVDVRSSRPNYEYEPLMSSDDFHYIPDKEGRVSLKKVWQWNHEPIHQLWSVTERPGAYRIYSGKLSSNVQLAQNTLTQRMFGPECEAMVTVDGSALRDGDFAGICALQGCYGWIALTKENGAYYLVMRAKELDPADGIWGNPEGDQNPGVEFGRVPLDTNRIRLKLRANFVDNIDEVNFYYEKDGEWLKLGITHKLYFRLDHFVGCRVGLFLFSTNETGGMAEFEDFAYNII